MATMQSRLADFITAVGADIKALRTRVITPPIAVTYGASIALNAALGNTYRVTMTGDATFTAPTNVTDGHVVTLELTASGGARTPTFTTGSAGSFKFGSDITAVTAIAAGTTDYYSLRYRSSDDRWSIVAVVKGY